MEPSAVKRESIGGGLHVLVSNEHRFGADAVFLADFASPRKNDRICDLGTGCGIIPMLFFRDGAKLAVTGVDIQPAAVELCRRTASENGVPFTVLEGDIKNVAAILPRGAFSLVTCNPPYFANGSGLQSRAKSDTTARHETSCTIEDVAAAAAYLLKNSGRFCLCHRPERLADIFESMRRNGIEPKRLRAVQETQMAKPSIVLIEGRRGGGRGLEILPPLIVRDKKEYSEEAKAIYARREE